MSDKNNIRILTVLYSVIRAFYGSNSRVYTNLLMKVFVFEGAP